MSSNILCAAVIGAISLLTGAHAQTYGGYGSYSGSGGYGGPAPAPAPTYGSPSPPPVPTSAAPAGAPPAPITSGGPAECEVKAYLASPWPLGGSASHADVVNLYVTSYDNSTISVPWTLSIRSSAYKTVEQSAWNWDYVTVTNGVASGTASSSWQALRSGYTVNLGAIFGVDSENVNDWKPTAATVNGVSCTVSSYTG